ncbi:N-acetylglucosamine kinase [Paenibacillus alba]|uniref:BadF/BadG/BcrA/BcrD ATPase family protein n=1 Tax=Paenibacillus alba TaxID=1197127 RepID=A0ABU6FY75_9BACL|nr:BadF/BadG/BcrA/BcrD ATPase family protein [Paenibacillus alba]MEC0226865.1 BadF/BadG/BcrA/BcrD ATPase family protein [Paenibacillus alba]
MKYYLGVDAGGSKTYTLITDEQGNIIGKGHSGNGNHQLGVDQARANITTSVEMALQQANLTRSDIEFAFFGLAGADRPIDYTILRPLIGELGFPQHEIDCDTMIALRAGTAQPYGVVLICGSGTNSAGKNQHGQFYQCGGFNYQFGDFGGGGTLAVEAFRSVIRAWDGRETPTLLTNLLLEALGFSTVKDMFDDFMDNNKSVPLHTAKLLFQAAHQDDEVALRILRIQGEELGKAATAIIKRLNMEQESFNVVLAGSVIARGEGAYIQAYIEQAVSEIAPNAALVKLNVEPVVGAVWLAMEAGGKALSAEVYEKLKTVSDYQSIQLLDKTRM